MGDVEFAECDKCEKGVCVSLAWDDAVPILVLACNCYVMRLTEALDATPDRWK